MRRMRFTAWSFMVVAALALLCTSVHGAKGGNGNGGGGKPGDGDGSNLPPVELVFLAQPDEGPNGRNWYGGGGMELYSSLANGSALIQMTTSGFFSNGTGVQLDARGEIAALENSDGWNAIDLATTVPSPLPHGVFHGWTQRRDASGDLRHYSEQRVLGRWSVFDGIPAPDAGGQPNEQFRLGLRPMDGGTDDWVIVAPIHTWDEATQIYVFKEPRAVAYIPEQTNDPALADRAWAFYSLRTWTGEYDASTTSWTVLSETWETRRVTLDVSSWDTTGVAVLADEAAADLPASDPFSQGASTRVSDNGRWVSLKQGGVPYLMAVDFSSGAPTFGAPSAADVVPVTPPNGWEDDVGIVAVNDDASLVALVLTRVEGGGPNAQLVQHLFAARSDGTDLTRIDIETKDIKFLYGGSNRANFQSVSFLPPSGQ